MNTGGKVAIGVGSGCLVVIIIGVIGFVSCTVCAGAAITEGVEQAEQEEAAQLAVSQEAEKQIPWLTEVQATCQRYDAAPNDIQKSAVFQENQGLVRGKQLVSIRGELEAASTSHGGGGLLLTVKVGRARFSEALIREGDPVYSQAAGLTIGQCVVFSGRVTDTLMGGGILESMEKARICRMAYYLEFDSIVSCGP